LEHQITIREHHEEISSEQIDSGRDWQYPAIAVNKSNFPNQEK